MTGSRKKRFAFLVVAFVALLAGAVLLICELYKVMEPVLVFGKLNLGIVLVVIGGVMSFLAPKIWRVRKGGRLG